MTNFKPLYIAINEMMAKLGAIGEINTMDSAVEKVMDELFKLDGGVFDADSVFPKKVRRKPTDLSQQEIDSLTGE